jgi:SAM-dependent methyltransferase
MASSERFGYEWHKYRELIPQYEEQFLKWVYPLKKEYFAGKVVLDAGCGMGRNSYWPLQYGASHITAFDLDGRSLAAARELLGSFPNAEIATGDIKTFDSDKRFDIAFSIGVIHHLHHPDVALRNLTRLLKPGGTLLMWVYGHGGSDAYRLFVRVSNPFRKYITSRLPVSVVHGIAYVFSLPLYLYLRLGHPRIEYLRQLKTFSYTHLHSIIFDQLIPVVANYWTQEEAEKLFRDIPELSDIRSFPVNGVSWTVIATKK